jgi:hypothetical protein
MLLCECNRASSQLLKNIIKVGMNFLLIVKEEYCPILIIGIMSILLLKEMEND